MIGLPSLLHVAWYLLLSLALDFLGFLPEGFLVSLDSECIFGNFVCANVF